MSLRDTLAPMDARQKQRVLVSHAQELVGAALGVSADDVAVNRPLQELGLDSVKAVEVVERLGRDLGIEIAGTVLFDHPTIEALCRHLADTRL